MMEEFWCGLAMGYFLSFLMLFCLWDRHLSQTQRVGIVAGMLLHLLVDAMATPHPPPGRQEQINQPVVSAPAGQALATVSLVS